MKKLICALTLLLFLGSYVRSETSQTHQLAGLGIDVQCRISTGAIQRELDLVELDTGTLRTDLTAVEVSTGAIQDALDLVELDTGTLRTDLTAIATSTGTMQTQINNIATSTGIIQSELTITSATVNLLQDATGQLQTDLATEVSDRAQGDLALGLSTATLQTNIDTTNISTGAIQNDLNAVKVDTGTLRTDLTAIEVSTGALRNEMITSTTTLAAVQDALQIATGTLDTNKYNVSGGTITGIVWVSTFIPTNGSICFLNDEEKHLVHISSSGGVSIGTDVVNGEFHIAQSSHNKGLYVSGYNSQIEAYIRMFIQSNGVVRLNSSGIINFSEGIKLGNLKNLAFGPNENYQIRYDSARTRLIFFSLNTDASATPGSIFELDDATTTVNFFGIVDSSGVTTLHLTVQDKTVLSTTTIENDLYVTSVATFTKTIYGSTIIISGLTTTKTLYVTSPTFFCANSSGSTNQTLGVNTWHVILGTHSIDDDIGINDFTQNQGTMTYTGSVTKLFRIIVNISVESAGVNKNYKIVLAKNGINHTESEQPFNIPAAGSFSTGTNHIIELATGENVEVLILSVDGTDAFVTKMDWTAAVVQ